MTKNKVMESAIQVKWYLYVYLLANRTNMYIGTTVNCIMLDF